MHLPESEIRIYIIHGLRDKSTNEASVYVTQSAVGPCDVDTPEEICIIDAL